MVIDDGLTRKMSSGDVAGALKRQITSGKYLTNERLPSERTLAETFGVARGTLREALRLLEDIGFVKRRAGSGSYVSYSDTQNSPSIIETVRPLELVDARSAIEPDLVRLAVLHATERDLLNAEDALEVMEATRDADVFAEADEVFHLAIARSTHNSLLVWLIGQMNEVRGHDQWAKMRNLTLSPDIIARYNIQHRAILDAIRSRDAEAASRHMREHLQEARKSLTNAASY